MKMVGGVWLIVLTLGLLVSAGLGFGLLPWKVVLFFIVGIMAADRLGYLLAIDADRRWLPGMLSLAYGARLVGAIAHHYAVTAVYQRGDAFAYHRAAVGLVEEWRAFQLPVAPGGSAGTRFVELFTGLLYVPAVPSLLIGFFLFATISFLGTVALYLAFRRSLPAASLRLYAVLLFFLPSLLYWPSTIGKEALMILALGLASLATARLLAGDRGGSFVLLTVGMAGAAVIRPHVAVMVAAALTVTLLFSRDVHFRLSGSGRALLFLMTVVVLWSLTSMAATRLGVGGGEDLEEFLAERERLTQTGGSAIVGSPVRNPIGLPEATLRVLFRPLPHEAHNIQALLTALEGAVLLALVLWRLPSILSRLRMLRLRPYLLYSLVFVAQFVVAFSAIFNLGILARQRTQALPFLLAVVVGMGWESLQEPRRDRSAELVAP